MKLAKSGTLLSVTKFCTKFQLGSTMDTGNYCGITGPVSVKVRLNNANCSVVRRHFDQVRKKWSENVLGMPTLQRIKPNYDGSMRDLKEHSVPTSMDLNCKEQLEKPSEDIPELVTTVESSASSEAGKLNTEKIIPIPEPCRPQLRDENTEETESAQNFPVWMNSFLRPDLCVVEQFPGILMDLLWGQNNA